MINKKTVIFITENSTGSIANTVKKELTAEGILTLTVAKKELGNHVKHWISDTFAPEHSLLHRFVKGQKDKLTRYSDAKKPRVDRTIKKLIVQKNPTVRRFYNMLSRYNPDVVLVSRATTLRYLVTAIQRYGKHIKTVVLSDELVLDGRLISNFVDMYFVSNFNMKATLTEAGIHDEKIEVADIPVDEKYFASGDSLAMKQKLGASIGRPTVLVNCTSSGDTRFKEVLDALANCALSADIIAACGRNRRLLAYARSRGLIAYNESIDINAALTAADLVITRPTTVFLQEAFAKGKPVFAILPTGGYEKYNFSYLGADRIMAINDVPALVEKCKSFVLSFDPSEDTQKGQGDNALDIDSAKLIAKKLADMINNAADVTLTSNE